MKSESQMAKLLGFYSHLFVLKVNLMKKYQTWTSVLFFLQAWSFSNMNLSIKHKNTYCSRMLLFLMERRALSSSESRHVVLKHWKHGFDSLSPFQFHLLPETQVQTAKMEKKNQHLNTLTWDRDKQFYLD